MMLIVQTMLSLTAALLRLAGLMPQLVPVSKYVYFRSRR
jgi:hypothetical protein